MKWLKQVQVEQLKLRHTAYGIYQILCTLGVIVIAIGTFLLYQNKTEIQRIRLFYDIAASMFPVLASVSIALMLRQEEQAGNLFGILFLPNRRKVIFTKILYHWGIGNIGFILAILSIVFLGSNENWKLLAQLLIGFLIYGIFFYLFHMFINLKFGMGMSVFLGIFEMMQGMIYSNIRLGGMFHWIPFSWVIQWEQGVLGGELQSEILFWGVCMILILLGSVIIIEWFQNWEGRRKYE